MENFDMLDTTGPRAANLDPTDTVAPPIGHSDPSEHAPSAVIPASSVPSVATTATKGKIVVGFGEGRLFGRRGLKAINIAKGRETAPAWLLPRLPESLTPAEAFAETVRGFAQSRKLKHEAHPTLPGRAIYTSSESIGENERPTLMRVWLDAEGQIQSENGHLDAERYNVFAADLRDRFANCNVLPSSPQVSNLVKAVLREDLRGKEEMEGSYYILPQAVKRAEEFVEWLKVQGIGSRLLVATDDCAAEVAKSAIAEYSTKIGEYREELSGSVSRRTRGTKMTEISVMIKEAEAFKGVLGSCLDGTIAQLRACLEGYSRGSSRFDLLEIGE